MRSSVSDARPRRVLACFHARIPSTVIRLHRPLEVWARLTGGEVHILPEHRVGDGDVLWADAVVLSRPATVFSLRAAKLTRQWRRPLVVDLDDHLLAIPETAASAAFYRQRATQRRMRRLLRGADAVVLSTEPLRDAVSTLTRRAVVIPNAAPALAAGEHPAPPPGETVALVTASDRLDCPALSEALAVLLDRAPSLSVVVAGDALADLAHPRVRRVPPMAHEAYLAWLAREPLSFALVPLARSPFHDCKSPIKLLDCAAAGLPVICAEGPVYAPLAEGGRAVAVPDTPAGWTQAILDAAGNPEAMRAMAGRARETAGREHTPDRAAAQWESLLSSLPRPPRPATVARSPLRVAVFAPEPLRGHFTGPNLRAVALARELAREFAVTLIAPEPADLLRDESFDVEVAPRGAAARLLPRHGVALSTGLAYPASATTRSLTFQVFDLCDPVLLELAAGSLNGHADGASSRFLRRLTRLLLLTGDHFLCASERQRDLWLGALYVSGRRLSDFNRPGDLVTVVPFGAAVDGGEGRREVLRRIAPSLRDEDRVLVWGGGVWDWFDPLTLVRAMSEIAARRSDVKLLFLGARPSESAGHRHKRLDETRDLAAERGLLGSTVHFHDGWLGLDDLAAALAAADVAVCTAPATAENHFAARTRLADAVAARLPIVCTRGSAMAEFVEMREIGLTCAPGDPHDLALKLLAALEPTAQEQFRGNLALCAGAVRWERCAAPVRELLRRIASGELTPRRESAAVRWSRFARYKLPCLADRVCLR